MDARLVPVLSVGGTSALHLLRSAVGYWDVAGYDGASQVLPNMGRGGSALDAQFGSTGSTDTNDPQVLPFTGTPYVYLPGVAGNYLSVPDAANLRITGDLELVRYVALDDWTPPATQRLLTKDGGTDRNYVFSVNAAGTLALAGKFSTSGVVSGSSTAALPVADSAACWVKATRRVSDGRVQFFYAADQPTEPTSWTQLGSDVIVCAGETMVTGTAPVELNSSSAGVNFPMSGKDYRAIVRNGIGGPVVLDVDTSVLTSGSATTLTARTGQTVTINRSATGRKAVAVVRPTILFGTDDYLTVADNDLLDFGVNQDMTVIGAFRNWGTNDVLVACKAAAAVTGYRLWRFGTDGKGYLTVNDGTINAQDATTAATSAAGALTVLTGRLSSGSLLATADIATDSTGTANTATATITNANPLRLGADPGAYSNAEFFAWAVFRRALSAAEIAQITAYYQQRMP